MSLDQHTAGTTADRTAAETWRVLRAPILVVTGIVVGVLVLFILTGARTSGPFSPDSTRPNGARALSELLQNHGVDVEGTEELADATSPGSGRTLLVAPGGSLDERSWQRIRDAGWSHLVLVRPSRAALRVLAPGVGYVGSLPAESRIADCEIPAAVKAGTVTTSGIRYSAPPDSDSCYGDGINGSVIRIERDGRTVDVVGTPQSFSNEGITEDGNAALALNLIGTHAELVWYLPSFEDSTGTGPDDGEESDPVIPPWVRYVAWALALAALVTALWRGRRLGPVVPEPLPVIVHAAETTEGRARLYRRSGARDRAAAALRESALGRLQRLHGIGRRTEPPAIVATVADRTGRDPAAVHALLYGVAPLDDAALLQLSRELDLLTQEVRRP